MISALSGCLRLLRSSASRGRAGVATDVAAGPERFARRDKEKMIIGNENDQVSKGQLVDALACTGDEGRDTLR